MHAGTPVHGHSFCWATAQCINQACRGAVEGLTPSFPTLGGFTDLSGLNAELRKRNGGAVGASHLPWLPLGRNKGDFTFYYTSSGPYFVLRFNFKIKF